jgi:hypothetical protein
MKRIIALILVTLLTLGCLASCSGAAGKNDLYKVKEADIIKWSVANELSFLNCACRFTEESEEFENLSKRREIKNLIKELKLKNPRVDDNLFMSMHNVNLGAIVGWRNRDGEELHSFYEKY